MRDLQTLVDAADEAALLHAVDGLVASRDWEALADLARRCRAAVELGKQLWPVATHIDYRLALEGPASYAGSVLSSGAGRFALGPLTEVAAGSHDWSALAPHIPDPASAAAVAQERVLRGEDLHGRAEETLAELPLALASFEPRYPVPAYRDRAARFPQPEVATRALPPPRSLRAGARVDDEIGAEALRRVADIWVAESAGSATAVVVDGDAESAVGALASEAALAPVTAAEALALLQWAGASGGAYGRRRGGAGGRFTAWWTAAALAGLAWPGDTGGLDDLTADLAEALDELRWFRWRRVEPEQGWVLRLAVADPLDGLAWAVEATDQRSEDDPEPS